MKLVERRLPLDFSNSDWRRGLHGKLVRIGLERQTLDAVASFPKARGVSSILGILGQIHGAIILVCYECAHSLAQSAASAEQ